MQYTPERLIEVLAEKVSARNEKHLSRRLKIAPSVIEGIRTNAVAVTPSLLALMADRADSSVAELRLVLGDRRRKARMAVRLAPARNSD